MAGDLDRRSLAPEGLDLVATAAARRIAADRTRRLVPDTARESRQAIAIFAAPSFPQATLRHMLGALQVKLPYT